MEAPPLVVDAGTRRAFDELLARGGEIDWRLPGPKHELLRYAGSRGWVMHGSARGDIELFEPRPKTDFDGRPLTAVFATPDGIWPIFFAVVRRRRGHSMINTCIPLGERAFYAFSISRDPREPSSWTNGWVYLLPRQTFRPHPKYAEWTSPVPVRPHARLQVEPNDFPFLRAVLHHDVREGPQRVHLRYAYRRPGRRVGTLLGE